MRDVGDPRSWVRLTSTRVRTVTIIVLVGLVTVLVGLLVYAMNHGNEASKVNDVCRQLQDRRITTAEGASVLLDAQTRGVSASDIQRRCGTLYKQYSGGLRAGPARVGVKVTVAHCVRGKIDGTATNGNTKNVDVRLRYVLLAADGTTQVGNGLVVITLIAPHQTVNWNHTFAVEGYDDCTVEIDSVQLSK